MINRASRLRLSAMLAAAAIAVAPLVASADVELHSVDWQTVSATGMVQFHLQWYNPDVVAPSFEVSGEVWAQEFGVYLPDQSLIGNFHIPPIPPESFFDVFFEVPLGSLPVPPEEGYSSKPLQLPPIPCPPGDHWDGNVDIIWGGPGGNGQVNYHIGQIMVCPGMGTSHIHMISGCMVGAGWAIVGVCPGWSVALLNEDLSPAPNPVPPNWTGWIAISANALVPVGQTCCFSVVFTCGMQTATVKLCATTCQCDQVGIESSSWSALKSLYR